MNVWRLRAIHPDVLPTSSARVLAALLRAHGRDGRATVRTVMAEAGLYSPSTAHRALSTLRDRGLVAWEPGLGGTLHPLVRATPTRPTHRRAS